jgi:hypothetical protein
MTPNPIWRASRYPLIMTQKIIKDINERARLENEIFDIAKQGAG